jgi:cell division protein FtsI/penicillin-binding protein 2
MNRMIVGGGLVAVVGLLLLGGAARLALIEKEHGNRLRGRAERQHTLTRSIPALRGEILDTRGRVLAGTMRRPSVFVDPFIADDPRYAALSVAPVLGMKANELESLIREKRSERFVWLKRHVSEDDAERLREIMRARRLRCFGIQYESTRVYPQGRLAAHVLGFVGVDVQGLAGIEQAFDSTLRGTAGFRTSVVDASRRHGRARIRLRAYNPPVDGATVVLTLDAFIQQVTEAALEKAVLEHEAAWGTAVVMDPHSGEVLAMATSPSYDPAHAIVPGMSSLSDARRQAIKDGWRNRSVSDAFEPGSIFKPFIAARALEDAVVELEEQLVINGPARSFGRRVIHDTHAYDRLTVREIISKSSNIGMGLIGARCGMDRLHAYVQAWGFGAPTGIGLPGESAGLLLPRSQWNPRFSPQSVPIGQEVAATPIQIVKAFSAFCNGGLLLEPRIVRGIIAPDGETQDDRSQPVIEGAVLQPETADAFREAALIEVVETGTGRRAQLEAYQVFGKTGTAQIALPGGGGYADGAFVGSFVGGAPADAPRVVVLVSIYKPGGHSHYGGTVAAPAAAEIVAQTLAYMQVPPRVAKSG